MAVGWSCWGQGGCFEEVVGLGEGPGREGRVGC